MSELFSPDYDSGTPELRVPEELRAPLRAHLEHLQKWYDGVGWGARIGFGKKSAIVVIDLALGWTENNGMMGSNVDSVVEATVRLLDVGREAGIPIFFTTSPNDPADPPRHRKAPGWSDYGPEKDRMMELDPRLGRRRTEKIIYKPYASAFNNTNFQNMLTALGVDTLIVTVSARVTVCTPPAATAAAPFASSCPGRRSVSVVRSCTKSISSISTSTAATSCRLMR